MRKFFLNVTIFCVIALMAVAQSCSGRSGSTSEQADSLEVRALPDTLRVGTLYSPTSYFMFRDTEMGYDYDLVSRLAADKGMVLKLEIAPSLGAVVEMLDSGKIDLIAYEVPVTAQYRGHVLPCGVESITHQVLVQPKKSGEERITDVTQLVGKEVYVEENSKYHQRLMNLDNELGGGIVIKPIDRDTLIAEDLIAMVSDGEIPLTVVDSDIARINKTYTDIDVSTEISFPQRAAWGVSPSKPWLADSINAWSAQESPRRERASLLRRYYELSKNEPTLYTINFAGGKMSPFDALFRRYARSIGWDWRLLASQGYVVGRRPRGNADNAGHGARAGPPGRQHNPQRFQYSNGRKGDCLA